MTQTKGLAKSVYVANQTLPIYSMATHPRELLRIVERRNNLPRGAIRESVLDAHGGPNTEAVEHLHELLVFLREAARLRFTANEIQQALGVSPVYWMRKHDIHMEQQPPRKPQTKRSLPSAPKRYCQ